MLKTTPAPKVVGVVDVYSRSYRINRNDYDQGRIQLRLYSKRNRPFEFVPGIRESVTIHRDNIATIEGLTVRSFRSVRTKP